MERCGVSFRSDMRAAAVDLLDGYAASTGPAIKLQTYPGRPASIRPPTAYVDRMVEALALTGIELQMRRPQVVIAFLHGLFDSKEAVEQGDEFVDGFIAYVASRYHQAGANTLLSIVATEDDPSYVADWIVTANPNDRQRTYYATFITLEGFATD